MAEKPKKVLVYTRTGQPCGPGAVDLIVDGDFAAKDAVKAEEKGRPPVRELVEIRDASKV